MSVSHSEAGVFAREVLAEPQPGVARAGGEVRLEPLPELATRGVVSAEADFPATEAALEAAAPAEPAALAPPATALQRPAARLGRSQVWTSAKLWALSIPVGATYVAGRIEKQLSAPGLRARFPDGKILGGGHSNVVMLAREESGRRVVVKRYAAAGTALAWLGRWLSPTRTPGGVGRADRLAADRAGLQALEAAGVAAARLLSSDEKAGINVFSFVEGASLAVLGGNAKAIAQSGRALRQVHEAGWAVIDNQPSNYVLGTDGRAYLIDMEHSSRDARGRYRAWDIASYLAWLAAPEKGGELAAGVERAFWRGYGAVAPGLAREVEELRARLQPFKFFMRLAARDSRRAGFKQAR